jgi:GNAT superfamily N-acetyltransferase
MEATLPLEPMEAADIEQASTLVALAMNPDQGAYARKTLERHFSLKTAGIDDGRVYYVLRENDTIIGLTGLHHWSWGPSENVWLGWFAVHPDRQGKGLGTRLLAGTEEFARNMGYRKLFIEAYARGDFEGAIGFYESRGYGRAGAIDGWLSGGEAMVVLSKKL